MGNQIGRFEILSEITRSQLGAVYKASDPESGQTIALKTLSLQMLGEQAATLIDHIIQEAEGTKPLSSHNIAQLLGLEEVDGQFCAAMEYVQGNSVATMLTRNEGFSIWDLQDIARQTCQGLDHAHSHGVVHYSLEPAKIMVTWDGTVKVLSFGNSTMGAFTCQLPGKAPEVLHYVSPEQLRGDPVDARSNIFSLGAILYEMVTEKKAFPGEDADQVRSAILESTPPSPVRLSPKVHPALGEVIMKAIAKAPDERYQSGQDLVNDLERCKESPTKAAVRQGAPGVQSKASAASSVGVAAKKPAASVSSPAGHSAEKVEALIAEGRGRTSVSARAAAAAAGWESAGKGIGDQDRDSAPAPREIAQSPFQENASAVQELTEAPPETPAFRVDPMMAEGSKGETRGRSFSEMQELPPLKEIYTPPPPSVKPEPEPEPSPPATVYRTEPEKPKVQPREVARKAVKEIRKTPPHLFAYSIAAALAIVLGIVGLIAFRIHSENSLDDSAGVRPSAAPSTQAGPSPAWNTSQPPAVAPAPARAQAAPERISALPEPPPVSVIPKYSRKKVKAAPVAATVTVPGQLTVNSTPEGAQIQIDGRSDPGWVTPFNLAGIAPGQHSVVVNRAGYAPESRTIDVASGSKSFLVVQLAALSAAVAFTSEPQGAQIFIDGKDTGKVTPAQISVEKPGAHSFLLRKQGYLEESSSATLQAGQVLRFGPSLKALGSTDEIRIGGGKFKKLFGGGEVAGMGVVSIKTQPKGAQVAVNNRIVDKFSPVDFYLNPGTYMVDITLSGYKRVHKVVEVQKNGKVSLEENLDRE